MYTWFIVGYICNLICFNLLDKDISKIKYHIISIFLCWIGFFGAINVILLGLGILFDYLFTRFAEYIFNDIWT